MVLVRIDDFSKKVSEYGQQAGVLMLNAVAQLLRAAFRDLELLAYYDVATLAVALAGCDRAATVGNAERFRLAVERCSLPFSDGHLRFTVSVSTAQANGSDALELLDQTEEALDAALKAGGNCTYFHNNQWSETAESLLERIG